MEAASGISDRLTHIRQLAERWRDDQGATYQSSSLWDERIKNFRSIRRSIQQVLIDIEVGTFLLGRRFSGGVRTAF